MLLFHSTILVEPGCVAEITQYGDVQIKVHPYVLHMYVHISIAISTTDGCTLPLSNVYVLCMVQT